MTSALVRALLFFATAAAATSLWATTAFADQVLPESHSGDLRPDWIGRCAARLERARDDLARRDEAFKGAVVESVPKEMAEAGDPSSKATMDMVTLRLSSLFVTVYTFPEKTNWPSRWHRTSHDGATRSARYEPMTNRYAAIITSSPIPGRSNLFNEVVIPAADDCLRMKNRK